MKPRLWGGLESLIAGSAIGVLDVPPKDRLLDIPGPGPAGG